MDIEEDDITTIPILPKEINEPCCSKSLEAENNAANTEPKVKNSKKERCVKIDDSEVTTRNKERCGSTPYHHWKLAVQKETMELIQTKNIGEEET